MSNYFKYSLLITLKIIMRISVSTIKAGKVYHIMLAENPTVTGVTRNQFESRVTTWAHAHFQQLLSAFIAIEPDLFSMVIIIDINNGHEPENGQTIAQQQQFEI